MIKQDISNTIKLLDKMASDAKLLEITNLQRAIDDAELSEELKSLIIAQDGSSLSLKLSIDALIKCNIVHTPDEDEDESEGDDESEQTKESVRAFA
ncbi:hypothetical protein [Litorilituus sediminis]|uniref:Uncharacterized protein n=1 Tax=Litorilituus sediminis TaxID=718192 RepID=A0A4V0ZFL9_9GAMM|nr:hypothetical protein [Litorilituus sediminis]QBG34260.1 hypothetical protein EMK97_00135 [Litorilituus sediminis]